MQKNHLIRMMLFLILSFCANGCSTDSGSGGDLRFYVFSDPHFYDTDLGTSGSAFEAALAEDRKLLAESPEIMEAMVDTIIANKKDIDIVIIPGDLTKDGELTSHTKFAAYLDRIEENGIDVFVIPGNHDINNPRAFSYSGDSAQRVANISPETFTQIYSDFGYNQALYRDADSLSYITEPLPGIWLMGLDSCKYDNNATSEYAEISGAFSNTTLAWIIEKLQKAKQENKQLIAFMHHGLVEHFEGQSVLPGLGDEYVVDDWRIVSKTLAEAGLNVVFTGHYHALDITQKSWDDTFLVDIETGSLVTYPTPYRIVTLNRNNMLTVETDYILSIDYDTGGLDFTDYSLAYLEQGLTEITPRYLETFGLPQEMITELLPYAADAIIAHYAGNETPDAATLNAISNFKTNPNLIVSFLSAYLEYFWTDLPPEDEQLTIDLNE